MIRFILILYLLAACDNTKYQEDFFADLYIRWMSSMGIVQEGPFFDQDKIEGPKGVWSFLFAVSVSNDHDKDCVYYQFPIDNNSTGKLGFIQQPNSKECSSLAIPKIEHQLGNITLLKIVNYKNRIELHLQENDKQSKWVFDFFAFQENALHRLHSTRLQERRSFRLIDPNKKSRFLKDGESCFDVNDKCEVVMKDECSSCPSGSFYFVVASACKKMLRKVCGADQCGGPLMPACPRGFEYNDDLRNRNYCVNDSPFAFCGPNLRVICENGVLVCR